MHAGGEAVAALRAASTWAAMRAVGAEATAREVVAADNVLDFFDMLYFDAGSDCGPNSRGRVCH